MSRINSVEVLGDGVEMIYVRPYSKSHKVSITITPGEDDADAIMMMFSDQSDVQELIDALTESIGVAWPEAVTE